MNKVMLAKKEVNALESALVISNGDKASVVQWHAQNLWDGERSCLNDVDLDTICTALYVGYEIEPSPEEEVLELYKNTPEINQKALIEDILNILNIQIKGINCK